MSDLYFAADGHSKLKRKYQPVVVDPDEYVAFHSFMDGAKWAMKQILEELTCYNQGMSVLSEEKFKRFLEQTFGVKS